MTVTQKLQWQKRQAKKRERRARRLQKRAKKNMSDAARLYRVIIGHILELMPPDMLAENCIRLAMLITGILRGKSGQLRKIANFCCVTHSLHSKFVGLRPVGENAILLLKGASIMNKFLNPRRVEFDELSRMLDMNLSIDVRNL